MASNLEAMLNLLAMPVVHITVNNDVNGNTVGTKAEVSSVKQKELKDRLRDEAHATCRMSQIKRRPWKCDCLPI